MNGQPFALFRRIYLLVFLLTAILGLLFTAITYFATTNFFEASTQLLNKDVAAHIAKFTSPYGQGGFDRSKADSVFQQAMVLSPSAEVYFLDTAGKVISFHGTLSEIKSWTIPVEPIERYIRSTGTRHIDGPDPRDPSQPKIFSAAAVSDSTGKLGYIYVILGSREYRSVTQMLFDSRAAVLILLAFAFTVTISLIITLFYIRRIRLRFNDMMNVLERFRSGDFSARFRPGDKDGLEPMTESFNHMADLLLDNIRRVTASEKERRDFMVNISHDLRTPLAVARGYAETLAFQIEQADSGEEKEWEDKEYGELVVGKIRQVENMVNQLFELSKMEAASFQARKEPFLFSELLQEVIAAVTSSGNTKNRVVECEDCTDGSWVRADISMMERVIQNLAVNALMYTCEGGKIRISLKRDQGQLVFRIDNEGDPLPADLMKWLVAEETDPATRPQRPAIGLAIVRRILHLHDFPFRAGILPGPVNAFSFSMPIYNVHFKGE